jgi:hypothetical protein
MCASLGFFLLCKHLPLSGNSSYWLDYKKPSQLFEGQDLDRALCPKAELGLAPFIPFWPTYTALSSFLNRDHSLPHARKTQLPTPPDLQENADSWLLIFLSNIVMEKLFIIIQDLALWVSKGTKTGPERCTEGVMKPPLSLEQEGSLLQSLALSCLSRAAIFIIPLCRSVQWVRGFFQVHCTFLSRLCDHSLAPFLISTEEPRLLFFLIGQLVSEWLFSLSLTNFPTSILQTSQSWCLGWAPSVQHRPQCSCRREAQSCGSQNLIPHLHTTPAEVQSSYLLWLTVGLTTLTSGDQEVVMTGTHENSAGWDHWFLFWPCLSWSPF